MNRCKRCVIPDTRPDTAFVNGVCSACLSRDRRPEIDWDTRKQWLLALLERHGGRCIVPSSGGKDSHWQVLTLLELGAKVQVVTATTCHLTAIGRANINNLARYAPTIEVTPDQQQRAHLNRLGLQMVGDISWPEHVAIFTTPFRMAKALDTPLIFYGENPQNEYGGPLGSDEAVQMTRRWVSEYGGFLGLRASDMEPLAGDMTQYTMPAGFDAEAHFLGQYLPWDSERNADVAVKAGMRTQHPSVANWWSYENLDNAQTGLHDHMMFRKYGYGRLAAQISVDIRKGRISRQDAMLVVKDRDGRFPNVYAGVHISDVMKRIDVTPRDLQRLLNEFTNWAIFRRTDDHEDAPPMLIESSTHGEGHASSPAGHEERITVVTGNEGEMS